MGCDLFVHAPLWEYLDSHTPPHLATTNLPEMPMNRNEMRALEREIKQTAADAAKVSEEFQLQLDVLRRREEDSAQSYVLSTDC